MRIITGKAKGCKLKAPKGLTTRPTADRVKESLYNIISGHLYEAAVLDLFAGTGNLGLEALSRGANSCVFVDCGRDSIAVINENIDHTKLREGATVLRADALEALRRFAASGQSFDIIFCDPPYNKGFSEKVLAVVDSTTVLANNGRLVIEHGREESFPVELRSLRLKRCQYYGTTAISFFVKNGGE